LIFVLAAQQIRFLTWVVGWLSHLVLRAAMLEARLHKIEEIEQPWPSFYRQASERFLRSPCSITCSVAPAGTWNLDHVVLLGAFSGDPVWKSADLLHSSYGAPTLGFALMPSM